jgi:hypothetical protein
MQEPSATREAERNHPFTRTALYLWGSLLLWMGNFTFIYVFGAIACARQFAHWQVLGINLMLFTGLLSTLGAAALTAWLMWHARKAMRRDDNEHSNFIRFVVLGTGVLVLVGFMWVAFPPLLLADHCAGGA